MAATLPEFDGAVAEECWKMKQKLKKWKRNSENPEERDEEKED